MEAIEKPPASVSDQGSGGSRWARMFALLHPAVLVATSLVLAIAVFLTGAEIRLLVGSEAALFKLLAGTALLFLLAVFFQQQLIIRQNSARIDSELRRGSAELKDMTRALNDRIGQDKEPANSA